ncbi:hypothetical protein LPJ56_003310 [Coemansia sp. RSA 2599]|nr:hypothetical protein LPJ56_003310 [Coemansia sp. RSA 2599]
MFVVSSNNAESVDADKMDADSAVMDKAPTLASLPTPISSAQSLPDSRSSSMVVDSPQTAAEPSVEPAPRIPTAAPLASLVAETNLDCMQVDEPEPASDIGQFIDGATATSDGIRVDSLVAEPNKASALAPAYASDMTSAMPSPISSGRVAKRRTARPRRPTLARKKSSADALDDLTLARHISDPNRMSIDHRESQDLATAIGADAESNSDALRRFKLENRQTEAAAADIGGAAVAPLPFSGLKRKSPEAESQASVMQTDTLFAKMAEDENSGSAPNPELAFESAEQTKFDIEHAPELAADSVAEVKAGAAVDADAIEDLEPDEVSDDEGAPRRQLMGTRTIRFKAPRDARVQIFELDEDDDQQMEQSQSNELTQSESNRMDTDVIPDPNEPLPVHFQALASPQTGQAHSSTTPRKKNLSRLAGASSADAPHSPSRVTTPHRVVYSPVNPKTVINPHRNGAHGLANGNDSVSDTPAKAPRFSLGQATDGGKDLGKDKDAYRARLSSIGGSRVTTGRMSTAGEIEPEFEETRVPFLPARRYVQKTHILAACGQTAPIDWVSGGLQACGVLLPELDPSTHTEEEMGEVESRSGLCKIGEATYSEVFSAQWRYVPRTRYDRFNSKKGMVKGERLMQVALKIIPFGNTGVKSGTGEPQTTLRDLYQEIGATLALSRLSERERAKLQEARLQLKVPLSPKERELGANFVKAFRVCICQGPLPAPLLRAWDRWKVEYPALCENVRPDYYPKNQLFAVFVLEMGGETLENAAVSTWKEARSILRQLALSMALAERNNRFEHRDLHWGNIMVTRSNSQLTFLYQLPPSETRQKSTLLSIPSYKVRCTIIDYTLSRLHVDNDANDAVGTKPANYDPTNNVFYVALKDEALFCGEGDIQYDVYRQMRECSKKKWDGFHPKTNVLWLAYVLHKIIKTKSPSICDDLMAFAESKLGAAVAGAPAEIKRAASQELIRRWISEFEQSESCTQALKCALLDLYKH